MARTPIPTWFFVLIAVRRDGKWLLVHERKHGQLWYLPAGRVEPGESIMDAAIRETIEEAGIPIEFDGVVRIEYTPLHTGAARMRVVLLAHPLDNTPPKQTPDDESLEAGWFTIDEINALPLRSPEVMELFRYLSRNPSIAPMSHLTSEGAPFPV